MLTGFPVIYSTDAKIAENLLQQEAQIKEPLKPSTHSFCPQRRKSAPKEK